MAANHSSQNVPDLVEQIIFFIHNNFRLQIPDVVEWSSEFNCYRINGVLAPDPVDSRPLAAEDIQEQSPEFSEAQSSRRKKRDLKTASIVERKNVSLKLVFCQRGEDKEYILEMTEDATGRITHYALHPTLKKDKQKVVAKEVQLNERVVPVLEEVNPPVHSKHELSLQDRTGGNWTIEFRRRSTTSEKVDKVLHKGSDVIQHVDLKLNEKWKHDTHF